MYLDRHWKTLLLLMCAAVGLGAAIAACSVEGTTPSCKEPDAADCFTAPGDAKSPTDDDSGAAGAGGDDAGTTD